MDTEQDLISAAHPMHTGRHDLYAEAMRLVGERESKSDLVDLVNWLLTRIDNAGPQDAIDDVPDNYEGLVSFSSMGVHNHGR